MIFICNIRLINIFVRSSYLINVTGPKNIYIVRPIGSENLILSNESLIKLPLVQRPMFMYIWLNEKYIFTWKIQKNIGHHKKTWYTSLKEILMKRVVLGPWSCSSSNELYLLHILSTISLQRWTLFPLSTLPNVVSNGHEHNYVQLTVLDWFGLTMWYPFWN